MTELCDFCKCFIAIYYFIVTYIMTQNMTNAKKNYTIYFNALY